MIQFQIFEIIVLIFSAVAHEYMHGFAAFQMGDSTAKDAGRLTLNPLAHLEWFGSVILPLLLIISNVGFVFGWAKPVPYNPNNLRDQKYGDAKVAAAGPLTNLVIALFFGLFLRFFPINSPVFAALISLIVLINLVLMVFNLVPIPPLDGSKILSCLLPPRAKERFLSLNRAGFILVILVLIFFGNLIMPLVSFLFQGIVGQSLGYFLG